MSKTRVLKISFWRVFLLLGILLLLFSGVSCNKGNSERAETIFCGGGLWSPPEKWNPITPWDLTTGTIGLIYETLYSWDPVSDSMDPWLAERGEWISDDVYQIVLRKGITWTDGTPLTAKDVKFTFEISKKYSEIYYSNIWKWTNRIEQIDNYTLRFYFSKRNYHDWKFNLYMIPIIPEHLWNGKSQDDILFGANADPVGTGPYLTDSYDQEKMIYIRNDNWWGKSLLNLEPKPRKIVYLKIYSNNIALRMLMKGELDFSNFWLPGIPTVKDRYKIHTWYSSSPYMLSDNTAFLFLNNKRKGLNDASLRKAISYAIDVSKIVTNIFEDMVLPSNSLGVLPIENCMKYYDKDVVAKYGFSYDKEKAKKMLDEAGYVDKDNDTFRENIDGSQMKFTIIVPNGWTDWMEAAKVISSDLRAVGVNVEANFPEQGKYYEDMSTGEYDFAIRNESNANKSIWNLYHWLFQKVEGNKAISGNFERYDNLRLQELLEKLNSTPLNQEVASQKIISEMFKIYLQDMPVIPLWFNGMWFHASGKYWENWPGEDEPYAYPTTWGNWQLGGMKMLTQIKSTTKK